jgi:hypothetical protein
VSTKQKTLFGDFYRKSVRPKLVKSKSDDFIKRADAAVAAVRKWRRSQCIDDFEAARFAEFKRHMKAGATSYSNQQQKLWFVKYIIRRAYPYRLLLSVHWSELKSLFAAELIGNLGRYYVDVFEPKVLRDKCPREIRRAIRRFHEWYKGPAPLEPIDEALLDEFEADVRDDPNDPLDARQAERQRRLIANVVNHWTPERIGSRRTSPPLTAGEGMVQKFAEETFIPTCSPRMAKCTRIVMRRLYRCEKKKPLPWERFTEDYWDVYSKWALKEGNRGKPMEITSVNKMDREVFNALSAEAAAHGHMRRSLRIPPLRDPEDEQPKNRYRFRTAGWRRATNRRAKAGTNGRATNGAEKKRTSSKQGTGKKRGGQIAWPAATTWLKKQSPESLAQKKPLDLRGELQASVKEHELPPKRAWQALVSRARRGCLPAEV